MSILLTEIPTSASCPPHHLSRLMPGRVAAHGVLDHCVDAIRQALMCHADTSIVTFGWRPHWRRPWPNFSVDRTCVDWDALDRWAAERAFSVYDQTSLVHPELGMFLPLLRCYLISLLTQNVHRRNCFSHCQRVDRGHFTWAGYAYCMARRWSIVNGRQPSDLSGWVVWFHPHAFD